MGYNCFFIKKDLSLTSSAIELTTLRSCSVFLGEHLQCHKECLDNIYLIYVAIANRTDFNNLGFEYLIAIRGVEHFLFQIKLSHHRFETS